MPIFTKKLFAENYVVTSSVTSMSIAQASGSTIFGDSADDTHFFIGSTISGSAASTASFGKYENITSFAGAGGTEALFSGSAASTGSFGRVDVDDTLNVGTRIEGIGDTLEIKNAELKFSGNGGQVTFGSNTAGWFHSSGRTYVRKDAGFTDYAFKAVDYPSAGGFWVDTVGRMIFGTGMDMNIYEMMTLGHQTGHATGSLRVSGSIISAEGDISGSAASTGSFGALTLKKYNQAIGHTTNTNFGIGAGSTGAGEANVAIGHSAGDHDTGDLNVAIGYEAAADWTSTADGDRNIAIGYQSMYDHNGGDDNIAIGSSAMKDGEGNGADNIAIGTEALKNIGAGAARNIAIGGDAQKIQNGAATDNISIGYQSLFNNTVGDYNVAVGTEALYSVNNPSGHKNVGVGYRAGLFIANGSTEFTSGSSNVFIGAHAYPNAINDSNEVVIGANAIGKGSNTVTIGDDNVTDIYLSEDVGATVHTGNVSGSAASTGSFGTLKLSNANGDVDIRNYVDGDMNVVIGDSTTGAALTSGVDNIIIGQGIAAIQTGENNVYIGARAGAANNAANNNVAIGYQALVSGNGNSSNVAIGFRALYGNGSSLNNTAVGYEAGKNTTSGEESVFLGFRSGDTNTTGDKNVTLGVGADVSTADAQNQIAIGFNATSTGDNQTVIGNSDQTHVVFGGSAIISGSATSTGSFGALNIGGEKIRASSTGLLIGNDNTGAHNSEEVSIVGAVPLSLYANAGGGRPSVIFQNNVGDAEAATLQFRKSRSTTLGGHTVVQDDDQLGQVAWYASDGDSWEMAARIQAKIDGSPGNSDLPTEMIFSVAADGAGSPTDRLTISPAGTVSGDLNDTSDRALKKNIVPLEDSTEKVKKLNPVTFDWEDTGLGSIGFIAQEIEELYPDAVNGEEGKKSIKISGIVAALTKTVQSLIEKNEVLDKRIKELEKKSQ